MSEWDSKQYLLFEKERTQPARDLAMRLSNFRPNTIADIGCGPGNSTEVLNEIFPEADILGIDSSENMIEKAKSQYPNTKFKVCTAQELDSSYDLLFSNACLHWIPNHKKLIPELMTKLNENGVLAVQVPENNEEPLFKIIDDVADEEKWNFQNAPVEKSKVLAPNEYYDILSGCSSSFSIWETKYYHVLPDHQALVDWVKGSRLRPYLAALCEKQGKEFQEEILERAKETYPIMKNGNVIFGFKRLFFVATK